MITIETTLAIFIMLGISSLALFWAKRMHVPHTVLLVIIGIGLGFLTHVPAFGFFGEFTLTPELLFYLFLPTLIFESAYHMNIRKLVADKSIVLMLAIGSFLLSTILIAGALHFALLLLGIDIPLSITFLFGALISATDPVAVLALFKEFGAPRRLSLIFEGESLFNDATAVAVFLITLEAINSNAVSLMTSVEGVLTFASMLIGGVLFGLLIGGLFAVLVGTARESEVASITLTVVLAHITFILAELISTQPIIFGTTIAISPIISTTVASLLMGNYGRAKIHPRAEKFVSELWEQFAFMANSLVFILIGILMTQLPVSEPVVLLSIVVAIIIVAISRAASIYPVVGLYNLSRKTTKNIPLAWQHLLAWGSLRGALAVTMVLIIPDDFMVNNWPLQTSPKDFLLALTIGCIGATLFLKATTIKAFIQRFKLDALTEVEEIEYQEAQALIHHHVTRRLEKYQDRGYINPEVASKLLGEHSVAFVQACKEVAHLSTTNREDLAFRVLRMFAIGVEKRHLKNLYHHNEVTEPVYRNISNKLQHQLEEIDSGNLAPDLAVPVDSKDVFEYLASKIRKVIRKKTQEQIITEKYMYYRAQTIISRKVLKEFTELKHASGSIFTDEAVSHVIDLYTSFKENSFKKLSELAENNPKLSSHLTLSLAKHGVHAIEESVLEDIVKKELISQKLFITLRDELR
jgi:CPA1 family monovalent cation:H+ antiporter